MIPDHEADAFKPPKINASISSLLNGLENWDGKHFLHISQHGYIYENSSAFFPLFPLLVRLFHFLISSIYSDASFILSAVIINFILFNTASIYLYKLTMILFNQNRSIATLACLFFSFNPASIFFSAAYSESLFSTLTFASVYYLYSEKFIPSLFLLFLSCFARSNGVLNCGYFLYYFVRKFVIDNLFFKDKLVFLKNGIILKLSLLLFKLLVPILTALSAFSAYQYYIYLRFCDNSKIESIDNELIKYGKENHYVLIDSLVKPKW